MSIATPAITHSDVVGSMTREKKDELAVAMTSISLHHTATRAQMELYVAFNMKRFILGEIDQDKLTAEITQAREHWRKSVHYDGRD